jgi:hypothetical protein
LLFDHIRIAVNTPHLVYQNGGSEMNKFLRNGFSGSILVLCALAAIAAFGVANRSTAQVPQFYGGAGITIFEDIDFGGQTRTFRDDVPNLVDLGWNDMMSSFRVGGGERWELCEDINYGGSCVVVSGSENDMRRNGWNDIVSSLRRVRGDRPPTTNPGRDSIVLYNQANFRGNPTTYNTADPSINDNARSVTVGRGTWEICDGRNFSGRCVTVTQDVNDLSTYNIGRIIRSIRPAGIVPPRPGGGADLVLFDQANYRGVPTSYNGVQTNIADNARSITVSRGTWQICDGVNFTGRCVTVTQDIPDLRTYSLGRTVRSIRPMGIVLPNFPGPGNRDWFLVLYDQPDFRGAQTTFRGADASVNKRTRSATVSGGVWEVCDGPNFTGRCQTLTVNVPNFRIYSIGDQIRSVRPQRQ